MNRSRQRGLTLIELMVAMVLGLLVTASIGTVYLIASRNLTQQDAEARLQQSGAAAMAAVAQQIQKAGLVDMPADWPGWQDATPGMDRFAYLMQHSTDTSATGYLPVTLHGCDNDYADDNKLDSSDCKAGASGSAAITLAWQVTGADLGTLSLNETFVYLPRRLRTLMSGYTDRSVFELGTFPALNDGAPLLADFCQGGCASASTAVWRTALVSSFGRGFPGGFAVDVTDAGKTGQNGVKAMWEFSEQTPVAKASAQPDPALYLGRQSAFPMSSYSNASMSTQVVRVKVGKDTRWAWVIGNGQGSAAANAAGVTLANDTAVLYLVFMDGAKAGVPQYVGLKLPGAAGKANGLSTPNPVDVTGDGTADLVYAGDLQGRMWRIDLSELDLDKGLPENAAKVVMEAANAKGIVQPVVGAPAVVQVGNSSRMVVFASGRPEVTSARYLDSTGSLFSLIGVKDDFKPGELPRTTPPPLRSSCAQRTLGAEVPLQIKIKVGPKKAEVVHAAAARGIAGDPMANEKCWAVDLGSGETGIGNAVHNPVGRAVELLSIESPSAGNGCRAGRSWINRINALTGKPVGVDVDGDGMIGSDEGAYGGLAIGRSTAIAVNNGKNVSTGNASNPANAQGGSGVIAPNTGRIWWREL